MDSMNILKPHWPQPKNIQAFTTLKECKIEDLNLPTNKFLITQEHGINILPATNYTSNLPVTADGSYTKEKHMVCMVKTADCLPILITNSSGSFVAAIHAGWRGLASGIIENFFVQTKSLCLNSKDLLFWLGPAISPLVFEVGEDVLEKFGVFNSNVNLSDFHLYKPAFKKINNINNVNNKYFADIYQIAKITLAQFGIEDNQIFSKNWCTYSQSDLFYSYRREPLNNNRMYSLIWIS